MFRFSAQERLRLGVVLLAALNFAPIGWVWRQAQKSDFMGFVRGGRHAGTTELLHPPEAFSVFLYTPGFAWLWQPLHALSATADYFVNVCLMLACAAASVPIAARAFRTSLATAAALIFAWGPTANAMIVGQTSGLGLLLAFATLGGLAQRSVLLTAIPLGLLLYKPTFALPLIGVLVIKARWRETGVVALVAIGWYLLSVAAAAGDWAFPIAWAYLVEHWSPIDFSRNAAQAIGIPTLLERAHISATVATCIGAAIAIAAIPMLRRLSALEAGSAACALGLAVSPHALGYDAVFALPSVFVLYAYLRRRRASFVIPIAYVVAAAVTYTPFLGFDPVAIVTLTIAGWWVARYALTDPAVNDSRAAA